MSVSKLASARMSVAHHALAGVLTAIVGAVRHLRREAAAAHAERHLERLNDDVLRDIGVHRSQIHAATRLGRGEFNRRYL